MGSCNQNKSNTQVLKASFLGSFNDEIVETTSAILDSTTYTLLQNTCMTCHSAIGKTHDALIAPPIIAVKRRYMMAYDEREDFIKNVVAWAKEPKEENGIMFGAIDKFKTMPL